jgi:hypothetical protein
MGIYIFLLKEHSEFPNLLEYKKKQKIPRMNQRNQSTHFHNLSPQFGSLMPSAWTQHQNVTRFFPFSKGLVTILAAETWHEMPCGPQGVCRGLSGNGTVFDKTLYFSLVNYYSINTPLKSVIGQHYQGSPSHPTSTSN